MGGYYTEVLAAERLKACYDCAPPRTRQYLEAEIGFVLERTSRRTRVLEMGCGYGRVLARLAENAMVSVGIDTSGPSVAMAREFLGRVRHTHLAVMNAAITGFRDRTFDLTVCIQNGVSAFAVNRSDLFEEAVRVTCSGGTVLFSSYSSRFWKDRLEWFEVQAARGLIGPIDYQKTLDGIIVCTDGFRATTVDGEGFKALAAEVNLVPDIFEVDGSSLFCVMRVE